MNWLKGFLSSGAGDASVKRLVMILSYIVSLGIAIFCAIAGATLEGNVMLLLLSLCGASTGNYALTNKNEVKDDKQPQD